MKTYMLWHGGSSYAVFDQFNRSDIEEFDSIADAIRSFRARADFDPYYPCVSEDAPEEGGPEAWLCFDDPYQVPDLYPDRILSFGPRGGVVMSLA